MSAVDENTEVTTVIVVHDSVNKNNPRMNIYLKYHRVKPSKLNSQPICMYLGPVKMVLYEGLREKDVGITEYTTQAPGISGILKHR